MTPTARTTGAFVVRQQAAAAVSHRQRAGRAVTALTISAEQRISWWRSSERPSTRICYWKPTVAPGHCGPCRHAPHAVLPGAPPAEASVARTCSASAREGFRRLGRPAGCVSAASLELDRPCAVGVDLEEHHSLELRRAVLLQGPLGWLLIIREDDHTKLAVRGARWRS